MRKLLLLLLLPTLANATTHTATSCSQAAFATAISGLVDGDTLAGPAGGGSATWASPITSTVTLAIINGNGCVITSAGSDLFDLTWTNSAFIPRITNFTFDGYGGGAFMSIGGNIPAFRVDHIVINAVPHAGNPYFIWFGHQSFTSYYKQLAGLIDHITYDCVQQSTNGPGTTTCDAFLFYGVDWSWLNPHTMGTASAIYIEDSSFSCSACVTYGLGYNFGTVTDAQHGAKFVVRHSTMSNMSVSSHDVGVGLDAGTRQYESYSNTFACTGSASWGCFDSMVFRGGTNMIYNNSIAIDPAELAGWGDAIFSQIFRRSSPGGGQIPWNGIVVGNPNVIIAPGNNPDGCPGGAGCSGPSTGGICSDFYPHDTTTNHLACFAQASNCYSNPALTLGNSFCGAAIYSLLPDYTGGAVTNTLLTQLDGGGSSPAGYPARNQTGAGPYHGANMTQVGGGEPAYVWGNTNSRNSGALIYPAYNSGINVGSYITANNDYYEQATSFTGATGVGNGLLSARPAICTTGVGGNPGVGYWATDTSTLYVCTATNTWSTYYTPYTYPHPLQGGGSNPPAAAPMFSPAAGVYQTAQTVTITSSTGGASITYCTDTTPQTPCTPSTPYTGTISVSANTYLRAFATASGYTQSTTTSGSYTIGIVGNPFESILDSGNSGWIVFTPGTVPASSLVVTGCQTYVATADNTQPWGCAIYTDSSGSPGTLLCHSTFTTTVANGWNSSSPSGCGTLTNGAQYWVATVTGSNTQSQGRITGTCPNGGLSNWTLASNSSWYVTWPSTAPANGSENYCYSQYATLSTGSTAPIISWNVSSYNYGNVLVGSNASNTFTLTNTGTATLNVSLSLTGSGEFTQTSTTCGGTLGAGANCTVTIKFTATSAGTVSGALVETDSGNSLTGSIALSGTGNPPVGTVATPTFSPVAGTYTATQTVTITTSTGSAQIVYTTDGSTPTVSGTNCTVTHGTLVASGSTVAVNSIQTLTAIGCLSGDTASAVATAAYIINLTVTQPVIALATGHPPQTYSLTSSTAGATICYTTNGVPPQASAGTCSYGATLANGGPVTINNSTILQAIGTLSGYANSTSSTAIILIGSAGSVSPTPTFIVFM